MKISVIANELVDGEIEYVSLVKHGANRSPFKIVKADAAQRNFWAGLLPELDKLEQRLAGTTAAHDQENGVITEGTVAGMTADKANKLEVAKLRQHLASLNHQQLNLWESPQHPLFEKLDYDLTLAIEKTELELAAMSAGEQQDQMDRNSAFVRRGGTSVYSQATVSDSAYERRDADLRKSVESIDLSTPITQTDAAEVAKVNLNGIKL